MILLLVNRWRMKTLNAPQRQLRLLLIRKKGIRTILHHFNHRRYHSEDGFDYLPCECFHQLNLGNQRVQSCETRIFHRAYEAGTAHTFTQKSTPNSTALHNQHTAQTQHGHTVPKTRALPPSIEARCRGRSARFRWRIITVQSRRLGLWFYGSKWCYSRQPLCHPVDGRGVGSRGVGAER